MNVINVGLVALHIVAGLVVVWLRLRSQLQLARLHGQLDEQIVQQLVPIGGRFQARRVDGSVIDVTVMGPDHDQ